MKTKARAWIEDGVIRCMSQMCEIGGKPCPRVDRCEVVDVAIGHDRRTEMLERLAETVRVYRIANYESRKVLEDRIDCMLSELEVDNHAASQEKRQT